MDDPATVSGPKASPRDGRGIPAEGRVSAYQGSSTVRRSGNCEWPCSAFDVPATVGGLRSGNCEWRGFAITPIMLLFAAAAPDEGGTTEDGAGEAKFNIMAVIAKPHQAATIRQLRVAFPSLKRARPPFPVDRLCALLFDPSY